MIGTFTDGLPEPLVHQAAWPSAKSRRSLAEWQRNFRHGSLPHTRHAPQGFSLPSVHLPPSSSILPCISVSAHRRSSDSALCRSRHCPTAASTKHALQSNLRWISQHIRRNRIAAFQVKPAVGVPKMSSFPMSLRRNFQQHFAGIEGTGFSCDSPEVEGEVVL
jgi:hypothetical protein